MPAFLLPEHTQRELHLPRLAYTALHRAVEVKDQVRGLGTMEVLAVEQIEHIERRLEGQPAQPELLGKAEVERGVLVILAAQVALGHRAVRINAVGGRCRDGVETRVSEDVLAAERRALNARKRLRLGRTV